MKPNNGQSDAGLHEQSKQRGRGVNTGWRKKINLPQTEARISPGFIRVVGSQRKSAAAANSSSNDDQRYGQDPVQEDESRLRKKNR